ncbi:MAG: ATP-dependent RecD-like DNA helicase [Solobacterium sp.]|nr:ATP-dependent RecD-like DNA helicase [Solobacterium sp.]
MEEELIKLNGKFTYILFRNEENYYTVAKFRINDQNERTITVTGTLAQVQTDILYNIFGKYVEHPRYGMQFALQSYEKPLPSEREGIIRYLSGIQFPGVGKKTAEKIVSALGDEALSMIRQDPLCLRTIPDLSEKVIESISEGIQMEEDGMEELIRFLNIHGIGMRNLVRLNKAYGKKALEKISENPYRVIEECDGFGFATADKIAMNLGFSVSDERRLYAFLVSLVSDMTMSSGDSYLLYGDVKQEYEKQTQGIDSDFDEILDLAARRGLLRVEKDRIYPKAQYDAEVFIASYLKEFPYRDLPECPDSVLEGYLTALQKDVGIEYDESQAEAIRSFFQNDIQIITGGPGTGKTTVVRALVRLFHMMYPEHTIVCAAPTGRAAKRLAELTDTSAATIHSLLQWDLESNSFGKNEDDPITCDLLIVDEFSMVDTWLMYNLLKAGRNIRKICLIGDEDQLPSVGPGSVLRDLTVSGVIPVCRLQYIYRQKNGSDVIALAHAVREGKADLSLYKGEVRFIECPRNFIRNAVLDIVRAYLDNDYRIDDIQVLSPMYNGNAGIHVLNNALQECFNPPAPDKEEYRYGYQIFREGDKILQLKNQPDDDVYNGDIGILEEIVDAKHSEDHVTTLYVNFQDNVVEYKQDGLDRITLAYAISVHKAQGSEYPVVIMPFSYQHSYMLQRKLIYTACTRARKALIMLGEKGAFERGIATSERYVRKTTLCERLLSDSI